MSDTFGLELWCPRSAVGQVTCVLKTYCRFFFPSSLCSLHLCKSHSPLVGECPQAALAFAYLLGTFLVFYAAHGRKTELRLALFQPPTMKPPSPARTQVLGTGPNPPATLFPEPMVLFSPLSQLLLSPLLRALPLADLYSSSDEVHL